MFLKFFAVIFFSLHFSVIFSQDYSSQVPQLKRYLPGEIIDPEYGIVMYNSLIHPLGGDSIRYNKKGYNAQGWIEDFYVDGTILHKGFYVDGQLNVFKNYYPNGQVERSFRVADPKRCELAIYYQDGKIKSEVTYYNQVPQKQTDYYANGNIEYTEENEKDLKYLYRRNTFYENGVPEIVFEIMDKKKKTFIKREFFANGKIKEEGKLVFLESMNDYTKDGEWIFYGENGSVTKKENYSLGKIVE